MGKNAELLGVSVSWLPSARSALGPKHTELLGHQSQAESLGSSPRSRHCIRTRGDETTPMPRSHAPHAVSSAGCLCSPRSASRIFAGHRGGHPSKLGGRATGRAYPVKESHIIIRQLGPWSAVAIHRRSSLTQRQEITFGWP